VNGFEGSFLGATSRIDPESVLECGVCWWIYDPARGDDTWQIPAGTAFAELPRHWRCPNCDAAREQFMVLNQGPARDDGQRRPQVPAVRKALRQRERELLDAYSAAAGRMRQLPVYNDKLDIQIIGLQRWQEELLCIIATPWCMNILLFGGQVDNPRMEGTIREVEFPSGRYNFISGQLAGIGPIESCSLFSPMEQFNDPAVVAEVARHVLRELLNEPAAPTISRRGFLRGGRHDRERTQAR
jgi:[NiFe] hydrogenase assembly HybE family chaperone